jgi:hypothetical protein
MTPWLSAHSGCVKRQASFFSLRAVRPFLRMVYSLYFLTLAGTPATIA